MGEGGFLTPEVSSLFGHPPYTYTPIHTFQFPKPVKCARRPRFPVSAAFPTSLSESQLLENTNGKFSAAVFRHCNASESLQSVLLSKVSFSPKCPSLQSVLLSKVSFSSRNTILEITFPSTFLRKTVPSITSVLQAPYNHSLNYPPQSPSAPLQPLLQIRPSI
jgi:hypothetical protein